jgi:threonine/homoserine/homoserine lactone efflux protein
VLIASVGLAALLHTSPWAFGIVRFVGVAYLLWLGLGIIRSGVADIPADQAPTLAASGVRRAVARGLVTNIANPKALLFCSLLLPQFISPHAPPAGQFLMLGAILVAVGFAFDNLYALAGTAIGRFLRRSVVARRVQQWVFGSLLIGFGARLALATRPGRMAQVGLAAGSLIR